MPFQTRKKCQSYLDLSKLPRPPNFFSNRKVSKLPKLSLSITYHQSFNKSNLLVKNIGFDVNQGNIIGVHLEYRQKVSKLRGPVKITRTQNYVDPIVINVQRSFEFSIKLSVYNVVFTRIYLVNLKV